MFNMRMVMSASVKSENYSIDSTGENTYAVIVRDDGSAIRAHVVIMNTYNGEILVDVDMDSLEFIPDYTG